MTLVLRYAPAKKMFSVQRVLPKGGREILAQIPANSRKDFVTIEGSHYAITPAMYAQALAFRNVYLSFPVRASKMVQEKVSQVVQKPKSWLSSAWSAAKALFSRKEVQA